MSSLTEIETAARASKLSPAKQLLLQQMLQKKRALQASRQPIASRPDASQRPLSYGQRRLWFIDRLEGPSVAYSMPFALRLGGALEPCHLHGAVEDLIARHEVLRSRIITRDGEPHQDLVAVEPLRLMDVSSEPDPEAALHALVERESAHVFRLDEGGLFRACLIRRAVDDHVLLLNMHHIVSDGWSMDVCFAELLRRYTERRHGVTTFSQLPIQYADYGHWQIALATPMFAAQTEYWQRALAQAPPLLDLPLARPRAANAGAAAGVVECTVAAAELHALDALCREEGATSFMVLLAAWYVLLARLSGQTDIVVGTPIANRNRPEIEPLIGFFANTLALRCRIDERASFRTLLRQVKECALAAFDNQELPFDHLVETLNPKRSLSHSPVFQAMFALQQLPAVPADAGSGLRVRALSAGARMAKFDLTLNVIASRDRLNCEFLYRAALFDRGAMQRYAAHFQHLLCSALSAPDTTVRDLPLWSHEAYFADASWRGPCVPRNDDTILSLFSACVALHPSAPAVSDGQNTLSYLDLDRSSNRLAHWLRDGGVSSDACVAVCLEHRMDVAVAFLAVIKAGGAYVPLPATLPAGHFRHAVMVAQPICIITERALHARRADCDPAEWHCIDDADAPWRNAAATQLEGALSPDALAYLIFTSGSTGRPKSVQLVHRGLYNLAAWQRRQFGLRHGDRVLQFASLGFDASVWEMTMALCAGAELHFAADEARMPGGGLERTLNERRISAATLPPSVLSVLDPQSFPALRCVVSAGEACSLELLQRWARGRRFYNAYGPSETTVCATSTAAVLPDDSNVSIGLPLDHCTVHVLDAQMRPRPVGCSGELYVGGIGLARGYRGQAALTAERFVPDPFSATPGARLYRTGDVVRRLEDGALEFRGRSDYQVKLRGFRIELGEIEEALLALAGVREACAMARRCADGQVTSISAFVTCSQPAPSVADMYGHLARVLPAYMRPAAITVLSALPLSANAKIDREALAQLPAGPTGGALRAAPATLTERRLAALWQALLQAEHDIGEISRDDDFFAVGGHSLLAVKLLDRVSAEFAVQLPLSELYRQPVLAELAQRIDQGARTAPGVRLGGEGPALFLVHALDGDVEAYPPLAARLEAYASVGLCQLPADTDAAGLDLERIATRHIETMRSMQPHGPYRLAGWSFGGILALEIAALLTARGESVEFVGVIDSGVPSLAAWSAPVTADELRTRLLAEHGEIGLARLVGLEEPLLGDSEHARRARSFAASNVAALLTAAPRSTSAAVHYFQAKDQDPATARAKLGSIRARAGRDVHCHIVSGDHSGVMREPHVAALACAMKSVLKRVAAAQYQT